MGSYRFPIVKDELNKIDILVQFFMASRLQLSCCIFYIPHKKQTCQEKFSCYSRKSSATATRRTAARYASFYGYRRTPNCLTRCVRLMASYGHLQRSMSPKQISKASATDFLGISSLRELFQFLYCASLGLHFDYKASQAGNAAAMPNPIVSAGKDA